MQLHELADCWCIWLHDGGEYQLSASHSRKLCEFCTVEDFWRAFCHVPRVDQLGHTMCEVQIFRAGVEPSETDQRNARGGQWIARIKRTGELLPTNEASELDRFSLKLHLSKIAQAWEVLVLSVVGGTLSRGKAFAIEEVQGVVLSAFPDEFWISLWNHTALSPTIVNALQDALRRVLDDHLGPDFEVVYEYLPHLEVLEGRRKHPNHRHKRHH